MKTSIFAWAVVSDELTDYYVCDETRDVYTHAVFHTREEARRFSAIYSACNSSNKPHVVKVKISIVESRKRFGGKGKLRI